MGIFRLEYWFFRTADDRDFDVTSVEADSFEEAEKIVRGMRSCITRVYDVTNEK